GRCRWGAPPIRARAPASRRRETGVRVPRENGTNLGFPHALRLSDGFGRPKAQAGRRTKPDREDPRRGRGRVTEPGARRQTRRGPRQTLKRTWDAREESKASSGTTEPDPKRSRRL